MNIFWTPIPIITAAVLFANLSWTSIRDRWWAKVGRTFCITLIIFNAYFGVNGLNAKVTAGIHGSEAFLITKLNHNILKLIEENRKDKAKEVLTQFNNQYPRVSRNHQETTELLKQLIQNSQ